LRNALPAESLRVRRPSTSLDVITTATTPVFRQGEIVRVERLTVRVATASMPQLLDESAVEFESLRKVALSGEFGRLCAWAVN
jgi:hypothetical protein